MQATQVKIATSVLQVLILVFAGFATLIYQTYSSDTADLSKGSFEVLAWLFMSVSAIFIYPAYLIVLLLLAQVGGLLTDILLICLGGFVTIPVFGLSVINLGTAVLGLGDIDWDLYQQCILILSGLLVFLITGVILYHTFVATVI